MKTRSMIDRLRTARRSDDSLLTRLGKLRLEYHIVIEYYGKENPTGHTVKFPSLDWLATTLLIVAGVKSL